MKTTDDKNELFVVVDKNDRIIGYKTRAECHSNKNLIHRASGVVIANNKGEILLQKRSRSKDLFPSYYTTSSSGHVNKAESYAQTARRELQEEIGIKAKLKFHSKFLYLNERETEINVLYTAHHNGPFVVDKKEVESVIFVSKEKLKSMRKKLTPYAIQSFEQLGIL